MDARRSAPQHAPRVVSLSACPVCQSPRPRPLWEVPDFLLGVPGTFGYVTCVDCTSVYQNPRVRDEDLSLCYADGYFTHRDPAAAVAVPEAPADSLRGRLRAAILHAADGAGAEGVGGAAGLFGRLLARVPSLRRRARYGLLDALGTSERGRRCLEVGPGLGYDLLQLRRLGWAACGLEMDPAAAANAAALSGCEVRVGTLLTTDLAPGSLDLIYMSHVLEHLPELERSLARCLELLVPGGKLVAVYPNPGALTARVYGKHSCVWDPPRHLTIPAVRPLLQLLLRLGFVSARAWTIATRAVAYRRASVANQNGAPGGFGPGHPSLADQVFASLERLLVALGRPVGEEIVVVAHRPGEKAAMQRS